MGEVNNIHSLLSQVNTIVSSYERVAQATGENFNVFQIFNLDRDENKMHSRFIETLLNPKGKHGQGSIFLELFLEVLGIKGHLDINTTQSKVEHSIGNKIIDGMMSLGGRIDIYLWDKNGKSISIENKIDAIEQEKQLVRYYNHNKGNNRVLYLTLDRRDASESSKGKLISDIDENLKENEDPNFYCISYRESILEWLEKCQKEAVESPTLRETIKQYKNLIKKLTLQNINSEMKEEIFKLISDNEDNFRSLVELQKINIKEFVIEETIRPIILEIGKKYDMKTNIHHGNWPNFTFVSDALKLKNIKSLCISSSSKIGHTKMVYGILPNTERDFKKENRIKALFSEYFDTYSGSGYKNWIALGYFNPYQNLEDYNVLKDIQLNKSDFKDALDEKIRIMIQIINEVS